MKLNRFILIVLCVVITLGGTFVCKASSDDDDFVKVKSSSNRATTR